MTQDIEIPKISQKHLLGIKYLSIDDINKILELAIFFKLKIIGSKESLVIINTL